MHATILACRYRETVMSRANHQDIRIGTMAPFDKGAAYLKSLLPYGFESFELNCWRFLNGLDLKALAAEVNDTLGDQAIVSSLGVYGNPMTDEQTRIDIATAIDSACEFGANVVCGFTGAIESKRIDEQIQDFADVWKPLADRAESAGVKIAFENCDMGGTWAQPKFNLAHTPRAWDMLFDSVGSDALGLEWEPCHQMYSLVDPIPQLRKYAGRVYHVHGKDATINWDIIRTHGIRSDQPCVWHRTPGFGDSNWSDIITILRMAGFQGSIDIEGWHDPVYRDELEITGQVHALEYLKRCRGGTYVSVA